MKIETLIRAEAQKLGFAAVGFASVGPARSFARFRDWLARGYAGDMTYLSKHADRRADPRRLLPEAQSVISVAAQYTCDPAPAAFAGYARGQDYHTVLRAKLERLALLLSEQVTGPLRYRVCVDSAPILEREWAVRAGLGWIGRQGSLMTPEFGCCVLLGELLVNIPLAESAPVSEQCGACRSCVAACPTGAIQPDGFIDARKCISYLTIEQKGDISASLKPLIGGALFGCDRCTVVCPRNRAGPDGIMPELAARPCPTAEECLAMNAKAFEQRFAGTPVYRTGLERLKRDATIAFHNQTTRKTQ